MDAIIERFFQPLIDGFWARYNRRFKGLEEDIVKPETIVHLWLKFDNFNPALGYNSMSYFTMLVSHYLFQDEGKAQKYCQRFINESAFDIEDEH